MFVSRSFAWSRVVDAAVHRVVTTHIMCVSCLLAIRVQTTNKTNRSSPESTFRNVPPWNCGVGEQDVVRELDLADQMRIQEFTQVLGSCGKEIHALVHYCAQAVRILSGNSSTRDERRAAGKSEQVVWEHETLKNSEI